MATILTFSMPGDARRAAQCRDTRAEVIVFPHTGIRALSRLSEAACEAQLVGEHPGAIPGDGSA